jgi:hypothetical protein
MRAMRNHVVAATLDKMRGKRAAKDGIRLEDFFAYMPMHSYIFAPTRELWPAASVNTRIPPVTGRDDKPMKASAWLDANAAVEQMTWAPGEPMLIRDRLIAEGGWFARPGATVFNQYRAPAIVTKDGDVTSWLSLIEKVFPDETDAMAGAPRAATARKDQPRARARWQARHR